MPLLFSEYMQHCIDLAMATGWTKGALGRAYLHLSQLYRRHGASLADADVLELKQRPWRLLLRIGSMIGVGRPT